MDIKEKVHYIVSHMLDFLFCEFDDVNIEIKSEPNRYLILFKVESIDEELRTKLLRLLKQGVTNYSYRFETLSKLEDVTNYIDDVRMETTDEETKILLVTNNEE